MGGKSGKKKTKCKYNPPTFELVPCPHEYQKNHGKDPCPVLKNISYKALPTSDRLKEMAIPVLRRTLAIWLQYADKFPQERRNRVEQLLTQKYGLSRVFLEDMLQEARKAREAEEEAAAKKKEKEDAENAPDNWA